MVAVRGHCDSMVVPGRRIDREKLVEAEAVDRRMTGRWPGNTSAQVRATRNGSDFD